MEDNTKIRTYYDIEFSGQAGEFFRIWIVNILLSIITLGIYSAWAKVRTQQYFYGNTYLDGSSFEYTADPVNILKGRLLAVGLIIAYQVISYFSPQFSGIAFFTAILFVPAIVVLAIRFRMRYSRWRGIHFNFDPDFKASYLLFTPVIIYFAITAFLPLIFGLDLQQPDNQEADASISEDAVLYSGILGTAVLLAGLLFPWWQQRYYQFIGNRTRFGSQAFRFLGNAMEFYSIYFAAFGLVLGSLFGVGIIIAISAGLLGKEAIIFVGFLFLIPYALAAAYIQTARTNVVYSNLELGDIFFSSELKLNRMMYLYITNTLAILLTLGLAIPWAKIRMARYRAETLRLYSYGFEHFSAMLADQESAHAEEMSDVFGWDVGL